MTDPPPAAPSRPAAGPSAATTLLREGGFARLFSARFISAFGNAMAPVAMAFGVLELTGSPRLVGLVIASQTAAQVMMQLFGGALADRLPRKRVMVCGDLMAAVAQSGLAVLLLRGEAPVATLCALMAVNGAAFALIWPASVGIVPQLVRRERLQSANALLGLAQSSALGLGGACAGVLVASAGAGFAIAADAATFVASAVLVAGLAPRAQLRSAGTSLLQGLREGWREFTAHRWLWAIVAQWCLLIAGWHGAFFVIGPVVAERGLGGAAAWGWVVGAQGLGLVTGGLLGMRLAFRRPMRAGTLCMFLPALPVGLLIQPAPVGWIALAAFVAGVGWELFAVLWNTALHTHVAPEALSRVSAYDILGSIALAPLGVAAAGPLVEQLGSGPALGLAAALIVLPTAAVLAVPEVRRLESAPATPIEREPVAGPGA